MTNPYQKAYTLEQGMDNEFIENISSKIFYYRQRKIRTFKFLSLLSIQYKADYSSFIKARGTLFTAILIYVDDFLLTEYDLQVIH